MRIGVHVFESMKLNESRREANLAKYKNVVLQDKRAFFDQQENSEMLLPEGGLKEG